MKQISFFLALFVLFLYGNGAFAKSYEYQSIDVDIAIHEDTTFTVQETQTFSFDGGFTKGWREIPIKDFDGIRDVRIFSEDRGDFLEYDTHLSQEYSPEQKGKYTYKKQNGVYQIWWFFDAQDEVRTWTIRYTVVGGITFLENKDELYWNILTDYDVPVEVSNVTITIPDVWDQLPVEWTQDDLQMMAYLDGGAMSSYQVIDARTAVAQASDILAGGDFTVALGFPRGIIERGEYWEDFFLMYWGYFVGGIVFLGTLLWAIGYWYVSEKHNKGRGTIVAEYEPPHNLPPAMGEVTVKEKISKKTWPATIVDLAVRGYIRIEEEPKGILGKILGGVISLFVIGVFVFIGMAYFLEYGSREGSLVHIFAIGAFVVFLGGIIGFNRLKKISGSKDYQIIRVQEKDNENLRDFEKKFLNILFSGKKKTFSTKEMRHASQNEKQGMYKSFKTLKKTLYQNMDEQGIYVNSLHKEEKGKTILFFSLFALLWASVFFGFLGSVYFFVSTGVFSGLLVFYMLRFEVKLNKKGNIEREKWLGFKEFLYRVHRYRVQDLTPETFEKYLPYAMVFGMEKQWAKQFEGIIQEAPSWYGTHSTRSTYGSSSVSGAAGFSAGAFSASLSSSFASTFSSSSGSSGASGGGGSAGGGGGGGGGGAS